MLSQLIQGNISLRHYRKAGKKRRNTVWCNEEKDINEASQAHLGGVPGRPLKGEKVIESRSLGEWIWIWDENIILYFSIQKHSIANLFLLKKTWGSEKKKRYSPGGSIPSRGSKKIIRMPYLNQAACWFCIDYWLISYSKVQLIAGAEWMLPFQSRVIINIKLTRDSCWLLTQHPFPYFQMTSWIAYE